MVTLWYRAPELLLGCRHYSSAVDIWAVGCIFGELLTLKPLFQGKECGNIHLEQLKKIFSVLGTPADNDLMCFPHFELVSDWKFFNTSLPSGISSSGQDLLLKLLCYSPLKRITAREALKHPFFLEEPQPNSKLFFSLLFCIFAEYGFPQQQLPDFLRGIS